jgi:hypothetical protein
LSIALDRGGAGCKVTAGFSMSLDRYVADQNDGVPQAIEQGVFNA